MFRGGAGAFGNAAITGGTAKFDDGLVGTPSITFAAGPDTGFYRPAANRIGVTLNAVESVRFVSQTSMCLNSAVSLGWGASGLSETLDTTLMRQAAGRVVVNGASATPAGGATTMALVFGSTSAFGIYIGSGAPSVSAAQGSLYLRSDGSTTVTRAYINNSSGSGTTWTAITTVA